MIHPPWHPLPLIFIKTYYLLWKWKCMFINPCKLLKSMGFPLLTGTWTSKALDLSKVRLGFTSGFTSSLTPPSLVDSLGLSLMTFSTSPSVLDFLTTPSELLTVALGFLFRWFKFTLKPPYSIAHDKLRLAIWDTSFWTFWLKFGHKGPWDIC